VPVVTVIVALLLAPLILLTFCFAIELFAGIRPLRPVAASSGRGGTAVIIVPAHDEEPILRDRLASLQDAAARRARIVVVADNCRDSTAEIAKSLGVEVIERFDSDRRGKGFALDFARRHLESDPPAVVLVIDADCLTDGKSIELLIAGCTDTGRPCQAINLQAPAAAGSPTVRLSTFAFFIKNVIRQRALQRLAGRTQLLGTGMAFPWLIFAQADLATSNIVEDLTLGQELAERGHPPMLIEEAIVWSNAESEKNTLSQRRRWEGGFLQNAVRVGPKLFASSGVRGDARGMWAALNFMIPPVALLMLLDLLALGLAWAASSFAGGASPPMLLLAAAFVSAGIGLAAAWFAGGSRFVTLADLAKAPLYLAWKLPMYLGFARRGAPTEWLRTERGG
jgi:cellulose synthase/poly-beta-1,6-N-acetylglucosamine synthase-like glycosyltransferase